MAGDSGAEAHEGVDGDFVAIDLHPGEAGGGFVAADGVDVETEPGVAQDQEPDQEVHEGDDDGRGEGAEVAGAPDVPVGDLLVEERRSVARRSVCEAAPR